MLSRLLASRGGDLLTTPDDERTASSPVRIFHFASSREPVSDEVVSDRLVLCFSAGSPTRPSGLTPRLISRRRVTTREGASYNFVPGSAGGTRK